MYLVKLDDYVKMWRCTCCNIMIEYDTGVATNDLIKCY